MGRDPQPPRAGGGVVGAAPSPRRGGRPVARVGGRGRRRRRRGDHFRADDRHHVADPAGLLRRRRRRHRDSSITGSGAGVTSRTSNTSRQSAFGQCMAAAERGIDLEPRLADRALNGDEHGFIPPGVGDWRGVEASIVGASPLRETGKSAGGAVARRTRGTPSRRPTGGHTFLIFFLASSPARQ